MKFTDPNALLALVTSSASGIRTSQVPKFQALGNSDAALERTLNRMTVVVRREAQRTAGRDAGRPAPITAQMHAVRKFGNPVGYRVLPKA